MNEDPFDDIRPFRDDEMQDVFTRLLANADFLQAVVGFRHPRLTGLAPGLMHRLAAWYLGRRTREFQTIDAFQSSLENYFDHLIETTTRGFTWSGAEHLEPGRAYLFVSNHRDIAMDPAFTNYALHAEKMGTIRIAIGDNLLTEDYVSDLMRLNKSFIVKRSATGKKEMLKAFTRTSSYLHHSVGQDGHSVWIAQREGRAKDGYDVTDPAILKMFYLSQRKSGKSFGEALADLHIVPVAISYELDPCDRLKAHELFLTARDGRYDKPEGEDLRSIIQGITGFKGRVHMHFGTEITAPPEDPDALAAEIDRAIHEGYRLFPTHLRAAELAGHQVPESIAAQAVEVDAGVMRIFDGHVAELPEQERPYVLAQYARPVLARLES